MNQDRHRQNPKDISWVDITRRWESLWRELEKRFKSAADKAKADHRGYFPFIRELMSIRNGARERLQKDHGITLYIDRAQGWKWRPELPQEPHERWMAVKHLMDFTVFNTAISAAENAKEKKGSDSQEDLCSYVDIAMSYVLKLPQAMAILLDEPAGTGIREAALLSACGFVASKTSLYGAPGTSLRAALQARDSQELGTEFRKQLLGAFLAAWEEFSEAPLVKAMDRATKAALKDIGAGAPQARGSSSNEIEPPRTIESPELSPQELILRDEMARAVREELGNLSPQEKNAVELSLEGRSYKDIASELGVQVGTVSALLHRAREKLARLLMDWK